MLACMRARSCLALAAVDAGLVVEAAALVTLGRLEERVFTGSIVGIKGANNGLGTAATAVFCTGATVAAGAIGATRGAVGACLTLT